MVLDITRGVMLSLVCKRLMQVLYMVEAIRSLDLNYSSNYHMVL